MALFATALVLALLAYDVTEGCNRRRRRSPPPCRRIDCQVSHWSSWSSCSLRCGTSGTQSRSRYKTTYQSCGGSCYYHLQDSRSCNRYACRNGGTPWSRGCSCRPGSTGTCCEYDVNECLRRPCQHSCHNNRGSYTCSCQSCYTKVGTRCVLNQCKIGGRCYVYKRVNPSNRCQDCNPNKKLAWSNNNALSCSDGNLCTRNDKCVNGVCRGTPFACRSCETCDGRGCKMKPGFCVIDATCRRKGDKRPGKPCQECNDNNPTRWTATYNNLKCDDKNVKTKIDRCFNGECRGTLFSCLACQEHHRDTCRPKSGFCVIQYKKVSTCFSRNTIKPGNPCQWCNVGRSTSVWTSKIWAPCDDGDSCTRSDTCQNGQCKGIVLSCKHLCQYCNGNHCSLRTGYGYVAGKCTCKIGGNDYSHQQINPINQCQWCDLHDKTARASSAWSDRPAVSCNDNKACTRNDQCQNGRCIGSAYTCQLSYPQSSCIHTSQCVGDGTCRDIMKSSGTICRPASDECDQPERCNGVHGACPRNNIDQIKINRGQASLTLSDFSSSVSFQSSNSTLYLKLTGFSVTCGALSLKWSLLKYKDACSLKQTNAGLSTDRNDHTLTGLTLQHREAYKIVVQATNIRGQSGIPVCTNPVTIDTGKPTGGWVRDGLGTKDLQYQSTKVIKASWGGFQTTYGVAKYEVAIFYKPKSKSKKIGLQGFSNVKLNVSFTKAFSSITDGGQVITRVRAYTKAGRFSEVSSDGVVVDTSPPTAGLVYDGQNVSSDFRYASWSSTYRASWTQFKDLDTQIVNYNFGVKQKNGGLVSAGLIPVGLRNVAQISGLNLATGFEYCALIEGVNAAGLATQATSNCVLIDLDAPRPGVVRDGNSSDIDYQSVNTVFSANWDGFDDGSKGSGIRGYRYKIEDQRGKQVTSWISTGLETNVTARGLNLLNGVVYYITIRALDKVGHHSDVKSDGVHVDTTHPVYTGTIDIEGEIAMENNETVVYVKSDTWLTASWPQFIDQHSGLKTYQYAIAEENKQGGYWLWKDIPGVDILTTRTTFRQLNLTNGKEYRLAIRGINNAGLHAVVKSSLFVPQSIPPKIGVVFDGDNRTQDLDYQTNTAEVHATWSGFDSADVKVKAYYFAVGSCLFGNLHVTNNTFIAVIPSNATSFGINELHLVNGQRYCVKIKAENLAGVQTTSVSTDGFLVDVTSPDVRRAKVLDGSGDDDIDYQTSTTELSATWSGIQDQESGIEYFEFAVSRNRDGEPDVTSFINVGPNRTATVFNLTLTNDVYYAMVCAVNSAGLKTCLSSDGVLVDPTSPTSGVVHDGILEPDIRYQSSTTKMSANWERVWDLESRIEKFEWGIGSSDGNYTTIEKFVDVGLQTHVQSQNDLALKHGHNYTVFLRIYNHAGGVQQLTSNGVTVDATAPIPSRISPGTTNFDWRFVRETGTYYSANASGIFVSWEDFIELESELWYYKWSIGTSRCATQIQPFVNIGLSKTANTTGSDVTLRHGVSYYVTVMARNRADLVSRSCSPAMVFDNTPPHPGTVKLMSSEGVEKSHFNYHDELYIEWEGFEDFESGVAKYEIFLEHDNGSMLNYTMQPTDVSVRISPDKLLSNQTYRVKLTCFNNAGLPTSIQSEEFTLDRTPPVYTGNPNEIPKRRFLSDPRTFKVTWQPFTDTESPVVVYEIGVGSQAFRDDIQAFTRNGAAKEFKNTELRLEHAKMYYVTVRAINAAGLNTSLVTEELIVDQTPPTGQYGCVKDGLFGEDIDFMSLNDSVSAHWESIHDSDSAIEKVEYCVGSNPSNCRIHPFTYIYLNKSFVCSECKLQAGVNLFARFRITNAAGLSTTFTSDGVNVDSSPPQIERVFDGQRTERPDVEEVDDSWIPIVTWYGARDRESGVKSCEWLVVKNDGVTEVTIYRKQIDERNITYDVRWTLQVDAALKLTTNESYFNVIQCLNNAGISTKLYSNGWSVVDEWPVASYVLDGSGTRDLEFDVTGQTLGARWGAFRGDARDPVIGYEWAVGTSGGLDDVMGYTEVGLVTHASQSLSDTDITLEPGVRYYITVKATSLSGRSSNRSSDGFIVDTTPPVGGTVKVHHDVLSQTRREVDITLSWEDFSDAETGIKSYGYCLGLIEDECFATETNSWMATKGLVANFPLSDGQVSYYGIVFATNAAGLITTVSSTAFTIDLTPPLAGSVIDGVYKDLDYLNSSVSLATSWSGFLDRESGIEKCILTVKEENPQANVSFPNLSNLLVNASGSITHTNLSLIPGFRYISTIECSNPDGFKARASSDGVIVDDSPPIGRAIFDGNSQGLDIDYQSSVDVIKAHWAPANDPESGIRAYFVAVGSDSSEDDVHEFFSVGLETEVKIENLTLQSGSSYYITVEIVNQAGLRSSVSTNGIIVDTTPPLISQFNIQQSSGISRYIGPSNRLSAKWAASDQESDIAFIEFCVGTTIGQCRIQKMTRVPGNRTTFTCFDCKLRHGETYFATIRVWNKAGLFNLATTEGITADFTPPISGHVLLDNLHMSCVNRCAMAATLRGFRDGESGIENCSFSIKSPGGSLAGHEKYTTKTNRTVATNLSLVDRGTYQIAVTCVNSVGEWSKEAISSTVRIDNTPPTKGHVIVSPDRHHDVIGVHSGCHAFNTTLRVYWSGFYDNESDITHFRVAIGRNPLTTDVVSYRDVIIANSARLELRRVPGLTPGDLLFVTVEATNRAGLVTRAASLATRLIGENDARLLKESLFDCINISV